MSITSNWSARTARAGALITGALITAWLTGGCSSGETTEPAAGGGALSSAGKMDVPDGKTLTSALRERFPDRAALVLEQGEGFVVTEEGFAPNTLRRPGVQRGVEVTLPREGGDPVRFRGAGAEVVRVREIGAEGEGATAEGTVAYRRAGGTSFWVAVPGGVEEWLSLDVGVAHANEVAATWEVEGATARQQGDAVELVDASGWVRLRVTAPAAYAADGRGVKAQLVGRGARIDLSVDAGGEAVLVDPMWIAEAPLLTARYYHTATLLGNGEVLVVGGKGDSGDLSSAELYNPVTGSWAAAAPMSSARYNHTATLLASGKVIVAGGGSGVAYLPTAELYDPVTNTWISAGSMGFGRLFHTATLLPNGKVIVAGGFSNFGVMSLATLYDPMTNMWSGTGSLSVPRDVHTATLLGSGKVLVAGGYGGSALKSAELYDPVVGTWTMEASMIVGRQSHTATLVGSGKVLIAGGYGNGGGVASAELHDPVAGTWALTGSMNSIREAATATLLQSGKVLVTGGVNGAIAVSSAELYDPAAGTWTLAGSLSAARYWHTATRLGNGNVLVTGGYNGIVPLGSSELYASGNTAGSPCVLASDCTSNICVDGVCCATACAAGACDACSIAAGAQIDGSCALLTGPACDDGNACTQVDSCQAGVCSGANPVACAASDQCHAAGACDPVTGICSNPNSADGSACNDGNACTQSDTCQAGVCTGANPVACAAPDQCHAAGVCDPATGICSNPNKVDGVACDDGDACTQTDTCQAGTCTGANPVSCAAQDQCHSAGVCDAATGMCSSPVKADGVACDDGNDCTQTDTCEAGVCSGVDAVVCTALDSCHVAGVCDAATGVCANPQKPDTASCDDGDACTQSDTCLGGVCKGVDPVECKAIDDCHGAGTCDSKTGICSTPAKPDGAGCADGTCIVGACVPTPDGGSGGSGGAMSGGTGASSGVGAGSSGGDDNPGGCGCGVRGSPAIGGLSVWLGLLLVMQRRRARAQHRDSAAISQPADPNVHVAKDLLRQQVVSEPGIEHAPTAPGARRAYAIATCAPAECPASTSGRPG